jgi:hypothetical protein
MQEPSRPWYPGPRGCAHANANQSLSSHRVQNLDVVVAPKEQRNAENAVRSGMAVEKARGVRIPAAGGEARVAGAAVEGEDLTV